MKRSVPLMALLLCASLPVAAQQKLDGAQLFVTRACVSCHGQSADKPIMPTYPRLAGQNADYAYQQMRDIKSGARNNGQSAAMRAVVQQVSDEEMKAMADWLSTLGGGAAPATGGAAAPPAGTAR